MVSKKGIGAGKFAVVRDFGHTEFMALMKAVKVQIEILTEANVSNKEIVEWTRDAMIDYCGYLGATVKVLEVHDNVTAKLCEEACA